MQVNSAQDYLTQVKRQILAKAPALALALSPQNRRSNDTYTAQLANRASRYEKVPYPQTLSLAPGSVPGFAYVTAGLRPTVSLCCVAAAVAAGFVDVWANALAVVTTLAGGSSGGNADGTGVAASFRGPLGVAVLPNGNIAVADSNNHRIRLITMPGGVVSTIGGDGTAAFLDGTGTGARFQNPHGVAALPNGDIVVADTANQRIRLISMPSLVVTTIAGDGTSDFLNATGTAARFREPIGIAVLPNGNIVVGDHNNHRIRLITMPGGVVTTLAGSSQGFLNGTGTGAQFNGVRGLAVLLDGNIVAADTGNHRIRVITPAGVVTTLAGNGTTTFTDGVGTAATFNTPFGVAVLANGNVVVADNGNNRIRLVTYPGGVVSTLAGDGTGSLLNGIGTAARFQNPMGATVLANGSIVVGDVTNNTVRLITPT